MKYFTIEELSHSATAVQKGIDNTPDGDSHQNLTALVTELLDPVRKTWGKPIRVNSGYRNQVLNKTVGGVTTSQHTKGEAADITTGIPSENRKLFELITSMRKQNLVQFDQLIDEKNYQWLHVSYRKGNNRNQILHL